MTTTRTSAVSKCSYGRKSDFGRSGIMNIADWLSGLYDAEAEEDYVMDAIDRQTDIQTNAQARITRYTYRDVLSWSTHSVEMRSPSYRRMSLLSRARNVW